ncbi:MAG: cell division protein FtsZ [Dehalococcoidia bacterium]|nr:cell division protein FtsZ [Dehalococcoidia bacterium]
MVSKDQNYQGDSGTQEALGLGGNLLDPQRPPGGPVIKVVGVGGGGSNAISRMPKEKLGLVDYYGVNTDSQHLFRCDLGHRLAIGHTLTRGLGAGANPDLGRQAAEESREDLEKMVDGADMVFLAAGMGGGTGTGACPVIAQLAKESGALTVGVVSRPFEFEAAVRRKNAEEGINRLREHVDTLIVIPNDRLLQMDRNREQAASWEDALKLADSVLQQGIQAIVEVVTVPGEINVDFADVRTILSNAGQAWLAIGKGKGESRAKDAAKMASQSPLLDIDIEGARRLLFVITGGATLTLKEVQDAADVIQDMADPEANVIFGTSRDSKMDDEVKVTMVASAFPVPEEEPGERDESLRRLLQDAIPDSSEDLDVPSFMRRQVAQKGKGFFR